jgi:hypothetical protein
MSNKFKVKFQPLNVNDDAREILIKGSVFY